MTGTCPYCAGDGIWYGCGDPTCCKPDECGTCGGTGTVEVVA